MLAQIQDFESVDGALVDEVATIKGFEVIFGNIVTAVLGLAGIVFFVLLIIGGFKYITSGGEPKAAESARNTLTFAVLGFVFIALAFLILRFIQDFTGINVTDFSVTQ